jgi:hypothetical protein
MHKLVDSVLRSSDDSAFFDDCRINLALVSRGN